MNKDEIRQALSDKPFPFEISIDCTGNTLLSIEDLKEFQGELKKRNEEHIIKILKSIRDYGFSFPFFYWEDKDKKYVLDGHGRLLALKLFKELGGKIPRLPADKINAKNKNDAKQKLLRLNSRYGQIDVEGFRDFVDGLEVNLDDLELPDIDMEDLNYIFNDDIDIDLDDEKKEKGKEIVCPKCGYEW